MSIEKRGSISEKDIRELVKMADDHEKIIFYELDEVMHKPAVAVVATGPRAAIIRKIIEEIAGE